MHMLVYENMHHANVPLAPNTILADTLLSGHCCAACFPYLMAVCKGFIVQDNPEDMESSILLRLTKVDLKGGRFSLEDAALEFSRTAPVWRSALLKEGARRQQAQAQAQGTSQ